MDQVQKALLALLIGACVFLAATSVVLAAGPFPRIGP